MRLVQAVPAASSTVTAPSSLPRHLPLTVAYGLRLPAQLCLLVFYSHCWRRPFPPCSPSECSPTSSLSFWRKSSLILLLASKVVKTSCCLISQGDLGQISFKTCVTLCQHYLRTSPHQLVDCELPEGKACVSLCFVSSLPRFAINP